MTEFYTYSYRQKQDIFVRTRNERGESSTEVITDFYPTVYTPDSMGDHTDHRGEVTLREVKLDSNLSHASSKLRDMGSSAYGTKHFHWQYIQHRFHDHREFSLLKEHIHIAMIDIEVYSPDEFPKADQANHPINAITMYSTKHDQYFIFHLYNQDWQNHTTIPKEEQDKIVVGSFDSEKALLKAFMVLWCDDYPDIVTGWNCDQFDMPYLYNRLTRVFSKNAANTLSPFDVVRKKTVHGRWGNEENHVQIAGVEIRDYLNLYLKYTFKKRESYKLDYIAHVELGERKVEYDQEGLHSLADEDPNLFVDYNWKDVWLIKRLDEKLGLLNLIIDLAYMTGINFEETDSPVKLWDNMITNYLADRNMHLPVNGLGNAKRSFEGAYVYDDLKIGYHRWIVSFDLTSLYPSIIRQWNMGPDTIVNSEYAGTNIVKDIIEGRIAPNDGYCLAGNGTVYRTDETSFLNALMTEGFEERIVAKDKKLEAAKRGDNAAKNLWHTRQLALKVFLNSGYGAFGNEYFRAFDVNIAEAITLSGQLVSKWLFDDLNDYLNRICGGEPKDRIVAGDTDSVYISLEDLVNRFMPDADDDRVTEFLDKAANKIVKDAIEPSYKRLQKATGCREQLMHMDREVIGSDAFWRAKKNYAIRILDEEGNRLKEPKYKIMGLEPARSTYRDDDRENMTEAIKIILDQSRGKTNDDLLKHIENYEKAYKQRPIAEVGSGVRVKTFIKYIDGDGVKSGATQNAKAIINYNNLLRKHGLEKRFQPIEEGDTIFVAALKIPNPTPFDVIAHTGVVPDEFGLGKYFDYQAMFEKNFFNPVKSYAEAVGWKAEDTADLSAFFGWN